MSVGRSFDEGALTEVLTSSRDEGLPFLEMERGLTAGTVTTASSAGGYPTDPNRCGTTVTLSGVNGATYTYCLCRTESGAWVF